MVNSKNSNKSFIDDYIPKVSRTFALTIKFLPRGLRQSVYSSYLLCRVADTLEDSPALTVSEKQKRLRLLEDILSNASAKGNINRDQIASIYESIDLVEDDDHKLLSESDKLFDILESLPQSHKKIIYRWAGEMAGGMVEYSKLRKHKNQKISALQDIEDWNRYCYYVAGTVGFLLTDLFIDHYNFDKEKADNLIKLSNSFGLGLQKVNVIKDVPVDRSRDVCFLPDSLIKDHNLVPDMLSSSSQKSDKIKLMDELINLTLPHLDDAIIYTTLMPASYKGVRMFLAVPVMLAVKTLETIAANPIQTFTGPPVKISRASVIKIVANVSSKISSNKKISEYYMKLRNSVKIKY